MSTCTFPLCKQNEYKNGLCINHHRVYGTAPAPTPEVKPIPKKTASREELDKEYRKLVKVMLKENDQCEVKLPGCTGKAQGLHHIVKRNKKNMCDRNNLLRACNSCNSYIENHPLEALEMGVSKSKHIQ
jgi:hypothetical protein